MKETLFVAFVSAGFFAVPASLIGYHPAAFTLLGGLVGALYAGALAFENRRQSRHTEML